MNALQELDDLLFSDEPETETTENLESQEKSEPKIEIPTDEPDEILEQFLDDFGR